MTRRAPFDRISSEDLMSLVGDTGSAPMQVGAVLTLRTGSDPDARALLDALARRLHAVPRLRQRLLKVPLGCGRPVWVNDSGFDPARHLSAAPCPAPGGQETVLHIAAEMLTTPLPYDRPLWTARLITDTTPNQAALVFIFHHVLTDGIGGLAILAALAAAKACQQDGRGEAHPLPSRLQLALDAVGERIRVLKRLPTAVRRLAAARSELRPHGGLRLAPSSLNRPTGPRRQVAVVRSDLEGISAAARVQGATVNDAVLTAAAASLHRLLQGRGESVEQFVISVPFSSRRHADAGELGNRSGVIPVTVPAVGDRVRR
uniref:wax ester/triacylglycerol synthase domain-containing protein n=1 Tax=Crystallibacter crystallopoietes TaxID=37928 RepID=UPI0011111C20